MKKECTCGKCDKPTPSLSDLAGDDITGATLTVADIIDVRNMLDCPRRAQIDLEIQIGWQEYYAQLEQDFLERLRREE